MKNKIESNLIQQTRTEFAQANCCGYHPEVDKIVEEIERLEKEKANLNIALNTILKIIENAKNPEFNIDPLTDIYCIAVKAMDGRLKSNKTRNIFNLYSTYKSSFNE